MPIGKGPIGAVAESAQVKVAVAESVNKYVDANETKNRRILVQGIVQAVVQSPIIAGLSYATEAEAIALVKRVSTELINFVDNN